MDYITYFTENLKDYLERNGLTMSEFAESAGITESCISKWLSGQGYPSLTKLIKVADRMNYSLDYLVGRSENTGYVPAVKHQSFCERLDFLLKKHNETFSQLARTCKFGTSIHAKWKKGKIPKPENLIQIAEHFNVSVDYLVGRSDSV